MNKLFSGNETSQRNQDLSKLSADEILRLKDTIIERARRDVDPKSSGFDAQMSFVDTEDWLDDWRDWIVQIVVAVSEGSTRVGLALIAGAGVIAAAQMFGSEAGSRYAGIVLVISGLFALWFVASAAVATLRGRRE